MARGFYRKHVAVQELKARSKLRFVEIGEKKYVCSMEGTRRRDETAANFTTSFK